LNKDRFTFFYLCLTGGKTRKDKKIFWTECYKGFLEFNPVLISSIIAIFLFVIVQKLSGTSHRLFIKTFISSTTYGSQ
jgi:hypothetical protein